MLEDWNAIDTVYFIAFANFTTVGYGDLYPLSKEEGQRIVGIDIFFITLGIIIIGGVVLGVLIDAL